MFVFVLRGVRYKLSVSPSTQQCQLYERHHHRHRGRTSARYDNVTSQAHAGHVTHFPPITDDNSLSYVGLGVLHTASLLTLCAQYVEQSL